MPKKTILFIEDDKDFTRWVASYLRKRGFLVQSVSSGAGGLKALQEQGYDLVLLDLGLPDEDGLAFCEKIRKKGPIPILILTARERVKDKVKALNLGADDYLVKPASLKELVLRINRLLKRNLKDKFRSAVFQFDGIRFDTVSGRLTLGDQAVRLTKKEKAVLELLLLRKGQVLTRMEIMEHVWGEEIDVLSNTVNVVISSLRRKLRQLAGSEFIQSVHGLGYKLENKDG